MGRYCGRRRYCLSFAEVGHLRRRPPLGPEEKGTGKCLDARRTSPRTFTVDNSSSCLTLGFPRRGSDESSIRPECHR